MKGDPVPWCLTCDELRARAEAADARIAELEALVRQMQESMVANVRVAAGVMVDSEKRIAELEGALREMVNYWDGPSVIRETHGIEPRIITARAALEGKNGNS